MSNTNQLSIQEHIIQTYGTLRWGIGILAVALPIILSGLGFLLYGLPLQDSISAYYHAFVPTQQFPDLFAVAGNGGMRNWFVGILWAIGVFLILYKGYGDRENWALNIAGLLLITVAIFPMDWTCKSSCPKFSIHGISAFLFFIAIGYVCIVLSGNTLDLLKKSEDKQFYKLWYTIIGWAMIAFPISVAFLEFFQIHLFGTHTVFFIEVGGIWIFAAYWLLKGRELSGSSSKADLEAMKGNLVRPTHSSNMFKDLLDTTPLKVLS
jgi:hypothetical protein